MPAIREIRQTIEFRTWLDGLRDQRAQQRIARLQAGLFGDVKFIDGIGELRIDHGPGYRVYFVERRGVVVILLRGGDRSTPDKDIRRAKAMADQAET